MSFDGLFLHALLPELQEVLEGGTIQKIYQPFELELQFIVRKNRNNQRFAVSAHANYYRCYLTEERPNNPEQAPMFCMLLRKYMERGQVHKIEQVECDRILKWTFTSNDEIGDQHRYEIYFELMGRHSNIVLVNASQGTIIDCIKHIPASLNSYRTLLPGAEYRLPPRNDQQTNLLGLSEEERAQWAKLHRTPLSEGRGSSIIQGMSGLPAQELAYLINHDQLLPDQAIQHLLDHLTNPRPTLYNKDGQLRYYACDLASQAGQRHYYESLSQLIETYYDQKVRLDRIKQMSGDLIQRLESLIQHQHKKIKNLERDRKKAAKADTYKLYGELLSAFQHQVERGQTATNLPNYYNNNELLEIPLDPRLSAIDNSQRYFKRYTKYRDSLKYIDQQVQIAQQTIDYLESVLVQVEQADLEDIADIKEELRQEGYLKDKQKTRKRAKTKSTPRQYQSSDGTSILVGRNNQQNDQLSMKKANKNHWWLHTKDIPGAHVIVESDDPSEQTMQEAAEIAAYYSKSRQSANVPVDTVQVRQLRKPNGARPGFVIYEGQETLYATPVEASIMSRAVENTQPS